MKIRSTFALSFFLLICLHCQNADQSQTMGLQEKINSMNDYNTVLGFLGTIRDHRKKKHINSQHDSTKQVEQIRRKQKEILEIWIGKRIFFHNAELVRLPRRVQNLDLTTHSEKVWVAEYTIASFSSGLDGFYIISDKNKPQEREFLQVRIFRFLKSPEQYLGALHERMQLEGKIKSVYYDGGYDLERTKLTPYESVFIALE
ncbi:hypothetical protein [Leptospira mayottensis]|nr:hypothetical protein [Leptospira mayottensis]